VKALRTTGVDLGPGGKKREAIDVPDRLPCPCGTLQQPMIHQPYTDRRPSIYCLRCPVCGRTGNPTTKEERLREYWNRSILRRGGP
jgi:hypothetical protein